MMPEEMFNMAGTFFYLQNVQSLAMFEVPLPNGLDSDIFKQMSIAIVRRVADDNSGMWRFYCSRDVRMTMELQAMRDKSILIPLEDGEQLSTSFNSIPIETPDD